MATAPEITREQKIRRLPARNGAPEHMNGFRPNSLKQNFSWTFIGNIIYTVCQWGMLMALTKLGTPEIVGQFVFGLAVTTPPMTFANLKARGIQASDAKREFLFSEYLGLTLALTTIAFIVIAVSGLAGGYSFETKLVILAVGLGKAFDVISDVFFGLYQQNEHMDRIAKPLMVNGILSLAALAVAVYFTRSVVWGAVGWAAAKAAVLIGYNLRNWYYIWEVEGPADRDGLTWMHALKPSLAPRRLLKLAWLILPLCVAAALLQLNANMPRYFIEHYLGDRELAFFAAMAYLMFPGNMVLVCALGQSAMPRLAKYYALGDVHNYVALLLRLVGFLALGGALAVVVVLFIGNQVLALLYTPEYANHTEVFAWITVEAALGFICSFLAYALTAARHFRAQATLCAATLVISVAACALLVPRFGLQGASATHSGSLIITSASHRQPGLPSYPICCAGSLLSLPRNCI